MAGGKVDASIRDQAAHISIQLNTFDGKRTVTLATA